MNDFFKRLSAIPLIFVFSFYLLLLFSALCFIDIKNLFNTLSSDRVIYSIKLSILTSTITSLLALMIAIPSSYILSRSNFKLKKAIESSLDIPFIISPVAIGVLILLVLQHKSFAYFQDRFFNISFAIPGIILAQFASVLGMAIKILESHFNEVPERYEMVASTLGAKPVETFFYVILPLIKRGLILTFVLIWTKSFGEFGATFIVAGSMPFKSETLPIYIYTKLTSGDIDASLSAVLVAFAISLIPLFFFRKGYVKG